MTINCANLLELPHDWLALALSYLNPEELAQAEATCTRVHEVAAFIWKCWAREHGQPESIDAKRWALTYYRMRMAAEAFADPSIVDWLKQYPNCALEIVQLREPSGIQWRAAVRVRRGPEPPHLRVYAESQDVIEAIVFSPERVSWASSVFQKEQDLVGILPSSLFSGAGHWVQAYSKRTTVSTWLNNTRAKPALLQSTKEARSPLVPSRSMDDYDIMDHQLQRLGMPPISKAFRQQSQPAESWLVRLCLSVMDRFS